MSTISAAELFDTLQGSEQEGFYALHAPVQHSPAGIPYLASPGVVLLARPQVHTAGLAGFLGGFDESYHFSDYLDDPTMLPDGAQLCKVAGQTCYMSFGPKRSKNAQA